MWIRIHYSWEEIAQVNLSKTPSAITQIANGRPAITFISGLLVTLSNQDNTCND